MDVEIIVAIIGAGAVIGAAIITGIMASNKEDRILKRIEIIEKGEKYLTIIKGETEGEKNKPLDERLEINVKREVFSLLDSKSWSIPVLLVSFLLFVFSIYSITDGANQNNLALVILGMITLAGFCVCLYIGILRLASNSIQESLYTYYAKKFEEKTVEQPEEELGREERKENKRHNWRIAVFIAVVGFVGVVIGFVLGRI